MSIATKRKKGITEDQLREKIVKMCKQTSQAEIARQLKIGRPYMNDIVYGRRPISEAVANSLGYSVETQKIFLPTVVTA